MDIDEILERAEQVEEKDAGESEHELLGAFKASSYVFSSFFCPVTSFPWLNFLNLFFFSFSLLIFLCIQVANFCNAEDDGSFWSRWIKPESVVTADVKVLSSIIII